MFFIEVMVLSETIERNNFFNCKNDFNLILVNGFLTFLRLSSARLFCFVNCLFDMLVERE